MEKLHEMWENKKTRTFIVLGLICLVVVFIGMSMTDPKEVPSVRTLAKETPQEGSIFGARDIIGQVDSDEAGEMVDLMAQDYQRKQDAMRRERVEAQRQNDELAKRLQGLEERIFDQQQQMKAIARGEGTVSPRRNPAQAGQGEQVANTGNAPQNMQTYGSAINPKQSQIITPGPVAGSPIIRTITQRSIRTLRGGEVTQQNVELSTISGRNAANRVEPVRLDSRAPLDKVEEEGQELFTLSMGSIISGTLLNGVAAPTSSDSKENPMPVLMRIKREAIMPNGYSLDIVDCHMLGSAIGNLSQSRVLIRAEAISCNTHTGEAIEKRINAYAVDSSDGLAGVQGEVIFKAGAMIANSMKAEFLSGFANAFSPNKVQSLNTAPNATQLWQTQNLDRAAGAGIGQGFSGAADRIADYYMGLAEEAHPVIELIPGIEVDFIVQAGMTLRLGGREKPYTNNTLDDKGAFSSSFSASNAIPAKRSGPNVSISLN